MTFITPPAFDQLPLLLTVAETANLLRTTRKAVYTRAERGLLPGAVRDGRRLLVHRDELLRYLEERRAPRPGGTCSDRRLLNRRDELLSSLDGTAAASPRR